MKILKKSLLLLATVVAAAASGNIDKALPNKDVDKVDDDHNHQLRVSLSEKGVVDVKEGKGKAITPLNSSGKLRALHLNDDKDEGAYGLVQRMAKRGKRSKRDCSSDDDDDVCSIHTFVGTYFYSKGCNGMSFAVDISCDGDEEHCRYYEESQNGKCAFESYMVNLHDYVKYDQEEEACVLGLPVMPLRSPEGFENEECAKDHPNGISSKIVAMNSGNLEIYFSNNYGEDFYNPDTPREAIHHDNMFNRRLLNVKGGKEEEEVDKAEVDETLSRSFVQSLEGRKLFAAFHEDSRRRLQCCDLGSIVDVADEYNFKKLVAAVKAVEAATGLLDTTNVDDPYTVFAPTDKAFAALPPYLLKPENVDQLSSILTYHVVKGKYLSYNLSNNQVLTTLSNGETVTVTTEVSGTQTGIRINDSNVISPFDVNACNGVIHAIDGVLIPNCLERDWFFDGQICTNGFLDSSNDSVTRYATLLDCCEDVFPQGTCDFNDICFTDSPTPSPTYTSTNGSTPTVSKETTGPPTGSSG